MYLPLLGTSELKSDACCLYRVLILIHKGVFIVKYSLRMCSGGMSTVFLKQPKEAPVTRT